MTPSAPAPARQRSRSFTSSFFTTNAGKPRRDPPPWAEPLEGRVLLADTLALVKDINDASLGTFQPYNTSGSSATQVTEVNGTVFFAANDRLLGKELWRTDGTPEGTRLVKDINPGGRWSMPVGLTNVNGTLFFYADDGVHGYELWKSDGSAAGTYMVEDIVAGPVGSKAPTDGSSPPDIMTAAFGDLYLFTTRTRTQVWRSDGTGTGTYPLRDIVVNPIPEFSFPGRFGVSNGVAYFQSHDEVAGWEIWKTDGTREGTTRLADLLPGPASSMPDGFVSGPNGLTYFSARSPTNPSGRDLYRTDGTAEGTILLRSMMGAPPDAHVMGGELYFAATRNEVWVTDGTPAGTTRVLAFDIDPAAGDGQQVTVLGLMNGRLLIYGYRADVGHELFLSDGTQAGTTLVEDLNPGPASTSMIWPKLIGDTLYFAGGAPATGATGPFELELYKSDGTAAGTGLVKDILPGTRSSFPNGFARTGRGLVVFSAHSAPVRQVGLSQIATIDLFSTDGTPDGTRMIDVRTPGPVPDPRTGDSMYTNFTATGDLFFFGARDGAGREGLWRTDGTAAGTVLASDRVRQIRPLGAIGDAFIFSAVGADDGAHGLWKSDGTPGGTTRLAPLPGAVNGEADLPYWSPVVGGRVYFGVGESLWITDGTSAGTRQLKSFDGAPDATGTPTLLTPVNGAVFFYAGDREHGAELWKTDGTPAGTTLVKDINPGPGSSASGVPMAVMNGDVYFSAYHPSHGLELWKSDGTEAGTVLVRDLIPGAQTPHAPYQLTAFKNWVYFGMYNPAVNEYQIWRTTGAPGDAQLMFGGGVVRIGRTIVNGDELYFDAYPPGSLGTSSENNLYKTDGTTLTLLGRSLDPAHMMTFGGKVYFVGYGEDAGSGELHVSDGTPAGTGPVANVAPGQASADMWMPVSNGRVLLVSADVPSVGREPWRLVPQDALPRDAAVTGRHVFYNNSGFDGASPAANGDDDGALATDKRALLPGRRGTFEHVTSYSRGINGIIIDIAGLPPGTGLGPADFSFRSGPGTGTWAADVPPPTVTVRRGAGANGTDRVTLTWPDYNPRSTNPGAQAVANEWLEVTVRANERTGLAWPDVFYFGNLIGDTGDRVGSAASVSLVDWVRTRAAVGSATVGLNNPYDFDRNRRVSATDVAIARSNLMRTLRMFSAPPLPPASVGDEPTGWTQSLLAQS